MKGWRQRSRKTWLVGVVALSLLWTVACGEGPDGEDFEAGAVRTLGQPVKYDSVAGRIDGGGMCTVPVKRFGDLDLEGDYLPKVVWCENREAPERAFEALKAQAIAARTYALYRLYDYTAPGDLDPGNGGSSQTDQSYDCGSVSSSSEAFERARRAVEATRGLVFISGANGHIVWGCYASGADRNLADASCRPRGSHYTEPHITRNRGKRWGPPGSGFEQTTLGNVQPRATQYNNHGCMGQKEANCLAAAQGKDYQEILRYFYGDIEITKMGASCFEGSSSAPTGNTTSSGADASGQQQCTTVGSEPTIISRAQWGARPYRLGTPVSLGRPRTITIHHEGAPVTRGPNTDGASAMRAVQSCHQTNCGNPAKNPWSDVGYHYVIMPDGQIYEGRAKYRGDELARGAHVKNHNANNIGIMLYGNFNLQQPTSSQISSAKQLVGWLADRYDISLSFQETLYGHRDWGGSECPGDSLHAKIAEIGEGAGAEQVCTSGGGASQPEREFLPTPDVSDLASLEFDTVRLRSVGDEPFRLDSVYLLRDGSGFIPASVAGALEAAGPANNYDCDTPGSVTELERGHEPVIVTFDAEFEPGDEIHAIQFAGDGACDLGGQLEVALGASSDAEDGEIQDWVVLEEQVEGNVRVPVEGPTFHFVKPQNHSAMPQEGAILQVEAGPEIDRVEYFAELYPLPGSEDPGEGFRVEYDFSGTGRRILTAKGYSGDKFVAFDQIEVRVGEGGMVFEGVRDGGTYPRELRFGARISYAALQREVLEQGGSLSSAQVECDADGYALPVEPSAILDVEGLIEEGTGAVTVEHSFSLEGLRTITCRVVTPAGDTLLETEPIKVTILDGASGIEFLAPQHRGWYRRDDGMTLLARTHDPRIVRVEYVADGKWQFGQSEDVEADFPWRYTFTHYGTRRISAIGYTGDGEKVGQADVYITLTDQEGVVPEGSEMVVNSQIPDDQSQTSNDNADEPTTRPDAPADFGNRSEVACAIMALHDSDQLTLLDAGPYDDSAYDNIQDTCNGGRAGTDPEGHAGGARVHLNMKVLQMVYDMSSSGYHYRVNWIAGGVHSQRSQHYSGQAVDVGGILTPSYDRLSNCTDGSTVGEANKWLWYYSQEHGTNQTLSRCGQRFVGSSAYLGHSTWNHSAYR